MIIAIRFPFFEPKNVGFYPKHYFQTDKTKVEIEAIIKEALEKIPDGGRMAWLKKQFEYLGTKPESLIFTVCEADWYQRRTNYKEKTEK